MSSRFTWERDEEAERADPVPVAGAYAAQWDDAAQVVTTNSPEGEPEQRPYSQADQNRRAAQIAQARLAAELSAGLGEMRSRLDAATEILERGPLSVTVSSRDPEPGDVQNRPEGALWEVRTEPDEHGQTVTLRRWYLIGGTWVQTEIMGNLIVPGTIDAGRVRMDEAWANQLAANIAGFQQAFIGILTAQMIQADTFSGYEVRGAKIISPGRAGDITISDNTITSSRFDEAGESSETMVIGGADGDSISLTPAPSEPPTVVISGAGGNASFAGLVEAADVSVDGNSLMEWLNRAPRGLIGWTSGSGASLPNIGNGAYGLVRFVMPIERGRRYRVAANLLFSGPPGDVIEFNFYWRAADGGLANLSSPQVGRHRFQIPTGGLGSAHIEHVFSETYDHDNYSVLISMRNWTTSTRSVSLWNGGGSPESQSMFYVEDLGLAVGSAGSEWDAAGGKAFVPPQSSTPPPPPPPPPPVKRTYTRTYQAVGTRSWRSAGTVGDVLGHGTHGGHKRVSQILFPAQVRSDLAGASIKRVEVRLKNLHTYAGSGMQAYLAPSGHQSLAGSPVGSLSNTVVRGWAKGQTKWETLSGWSSSSQSVWLGVGAPGSGAYYGKFSRALSDCVLRVTYEK